MDGATATDAANTGPRSSWRPEAWLCDREALALACSAIRIKSLQLTQLQHGERRKAVACHGFVRSIPFELSARRNRPAPQVLGSAAATAMEKGNLLVALLRSCGIPSRLRVYSLAGAHLRGLANAQVAVLHPAVEALLDGRWIGTDIFHLDAPLAAAARRRLLREGQRCGWGAHLDGTVDWDGANDAYSIPDLQRGGAGCAFEWGVFHDSSDFARISRSLAQALEPAAAPVRRWLESWALDRMRTADGSPAARQPA